MTKCEILVRYVLHHAPYVTQELLKGHHTQAYLHGNPFMYSVKFYQVLACSNA